MRDSLLFSSLLLTHEKGATPSWLGLAAFSLVFVQRQRQTHLPWQLYNQHNSGSQTEGHRQARHCMHAFGNHQNSLDFFLVFFVSRYSSDVTKFLLPSAAQRGLWVSFPSILLGEEKREEGAEKLKTHQTHRCSRENGANTKRPSQPAPATTTRSGNSRVVVKQGRKMRGVVEMEAPCGVGGEMSWTLVLQRRGAESSHPSPTGNPPVPFFHSIAVRLPPKPLRDGGRA